jgi:hypothetical protein
MRTYTHTLADFIENPIPLRDYDLAALDERLAIEFQIHNTLTSDMFGYFVDNTVAEIESLPTGITSLNFGRTDGIAVGMTGRTDSTPQRVGYPLDGYDASIGWNAGFFSRATTAEMARTVDSIEIADIVGMKSLLSLAIYTKLNADLYISPFQTNHSVNTPIDVKRFWNADGQIPPKSWSGTIFNGTHTHFLAANGATGAALTTALDSLIYTVEEHSQGNKTILVINNLDAAKIKASSKFVEALPPQIIASSTERRVNFALNTAQTDDRDIGSYDGRLVVVKPWALPGYVLCLNTGGDKPIKMREPVIESERGLKLDSQNVLYRLQANTWLRQVGFGVYNRSAGAVLDLVNAAYTTPTFSF